MNYVAEEFTPEERDILRPYFTNLDGPVFALVNLPEVVKGALFARYSRSSKSLRRLFLDEFVGELDTAGDTTVDATVGLERAEALYDRVFFEYGDDSVAQLGGVHLACEQASNILTKILEWGRLMSYLEQSTRYIPYDSRLGGRYRYHRDPDILASNLGARYVAGMDELFSTYSELAAAMTEYFRALHPKGEGDSDFVHRQAVRAKAFDSVRGILPAAALSNVGIYGSGQAYEALLVRMRASSLPEAVNYAELMLSELRKVVPSFLKRVDLPDRGVAHSAYLAECHSRMEAIAYEVLAE
ncbi:MAG: FAD-dependent thymidylate synthase, partial [Microthrixaceae bacterium]|nr:FAD-dependent thymidylate synthase [Microthrixaceae bacterium]